MFPVGTLEIKVDACGIIGMILQSSTFFFRKLGGKITPRGDVPTSLQAYIATTISVEHNQAATVNGRPPQQQQQQQRPPLPNRPPALPVAASAGPLDFDSSRGACGPLMLDERRRRAKTTTAAPTVGRHATSSPPLPMLPESGKPEVLSPVLPTPPLH